MTVTKVIRVLAVGVTALFGLVGALFVAGEGHTDPGGWTGVALVVSWGLPMAALVLLALLRPDAASRVLPWALAFVAVPCGLLGLHKAGEAGLLVLGAAFLQLLGAVAQHARRAGDSVPSLAHALGGSAGVMVVPLLVCATLLLVAAVLQGRTGHHGHLHVVR